MPKGKTCSDAYFLCTALDRFFWNFSIRYYYNSGPYIYVQTALCAAAGGSCPFLVYGTVSGRRQHQADGSISTQYSSAVRFSQSTVSRTYLMHRCLHFVYCSGRFFFFTFSIKISITMVLILIQTALRAAAGGSCPLLVYGTAVSGRRQHQYTVQQCLVILAVNSQQYVPACCLLSVCLCPMRQHQRLHVVCHMCGVHVCACS